MCKSRLHTQAQEKTNKEDGLIVTSKNNKLGIGQEIECPRCHNIMTLCSDFDKLCYICEECSFILALNYSL
jgi:hypothetical protein